MPIARRTALLSGFNLLLGGGVAVLASACSRAGAASPAKEHFEVEMTDDQWKAKLSPQAYAVLRHEGTETPFTSPLNDEHRKGTFTCAGCGADLFPSDTKFESGSGWPSFYRALDQGTINEHEDRSFGTTRTEITCARCGGHLGHVFPDGPAPTGLRYCVNSLSLEYKPE